MTSTSAPGFGVSAISGGGDPKDSTWGAFSSGNGIVLATGV
jgi:hypothetical protein